MNRYHTYLRRIRQKAQNEQRGATLIEMVISAGILGMTSVAFVGAMATTLTAGVSMVTTTTPIGRTTWIYPGSR